MSSHGDGVGRREGGSVGRGVGGAVGRGVAWREGCGVPKLHWHSKLHCCEKKRECARCC